MKKIFIIIIMLLWVLVLCYLTIITHSGTTANPATTSAAEEILGQIQVEGALPKLGEGEEIQPVEDWNLSNLEEGEWTFLSERGGWTLLLFPDQIWVIRKEQPTLKWAVPLDTSYLGEKNGLMLFESNTQDFWVLDSKNPVLITRYPIRFD